MNSSTLVGRIEEINEIKELENGEKKVTITLAVTRSYQNEEGEYETDFIPCVLWGNTAKTTTEYCEKGDVIGIRGRLQMSCRKLVVVAERVTFLSTKERKED